MLAPGASWCGPYHHVVTNAERVVANHPEWKDKVFTLAVSVDADKDSAGKAAREEKWTRVVWAGEEAAFAFRVTHLPLTYLITPDGKVAMAEADHVAFWAPAVLMRTAAEKAAAEARGPTTAPTR